MVGQLAENGLARNAGHDAIGNYLERTNGTKPACMYPFGKLVFALKAIVLLSTEMMMCICQMFRIPAVERAQETMLPHK